MNGRIIAILLLATASGLWANFLLPWAAPARSQENRGYTLQSVYSRLVAVQNDLAELKRTVDEMNDTVTEIKTGTCRNPKIC
jgi:hypothetical protein